MLECFIKARKTKILPHTGRIYVRYDVPSDGIHPLETGGGTIYAFASLAPEAREPGSLSPRPDLRMVAMGHAVGVPTNEATSATKSFLFRRSIATFRSCLFADVMESTARRHRWNVHFFMGFTS